MAKITGAKCRICRREGIKLFLKGNRCDTAKCAMEKNPQVPGQHGAKRQRFTDYGKHLREKQKVKRLYGVAERQFKHYFTEASRQTGNTGENLLIILERRLDNTVFLGKMAPSRTAARQLIFHGHILVNGRRASIPSMSVNAGDIITPKTKEKSMKIVKSFMDTINKEQIPSWLKLSEEPLQLQVTQLPKRIDIVAPVNEQMVVEFCSR